MLRTTKKLKKFSLLLLSVLFGFIASLFLLGAKGDVTKIARADVGPIAVDPPCPGPGCCA